MRRAMWLVVIAFVGLTPRAFGTSMWELTPYRVRIWIASEQRPEFGDECIDELSRRLARRAESAAGGAWRVEVSAAPGQLARSVVTADEIPVNQVIAADPNWFDVDKIVLVGLARREGGFSVDARELDVATLQWGRRVRHIARQRSVISDAATRAVIDCFAPLGRIESVDEGVAHVALKAGEMARDGSPVFLESGALLQPVVRRNDRFGRPDPGAIRAVPWTVLQVDERELGTVECTIYSGMRRALRGRSSYRTKRLALAVHPIRRPTTIELRSRVEPHEPLAGYELFVRTDSDAPAQPLAETGYDGRAVVPADDAPLRLVYVKSGQRVLARLPLVTGQEGPVTILLTDDGPRLAAEAFLAGIEGRLTDVAVRRAFMAAQIRRQIKEGEASKAAELLEEFQRLPTRVQLDSALQQEKAKLNVADAAVGREIEKLFLATRERITKYLDPQFDRKLAEDVAKMPATRPTDTSDEG